MQTKPRPFASSGSSSSSTAGTTGIPATPTPISQNLQQQFLGNRNAISTQRNVNALQTQADHGLTAAGAQSVCRGQQPASLIDQTRLAGQGDSASHAGDLNEWRSRFGAGI